MYDTRFTELSTMPPITTYDSRLTFFPRQRLIMRKNTTRSAHQISPGSAWGHPSRRSALAGQSTMNSLTPVVV